jgi:parallel beta-helix repeat protein
MKKLWIGTVILVVATYLSTSPAGASEVHSDCSPVMVDSVLVADLHCPSEMEVGVPDGIAVAPGVTLDLNGHTIYGRVRFGASEVRNGAVDGTDVRFGFSGYPHGCIILGSESVLDTVEVRNCVWGVIHGRGVHNPCPDSCGALIRNSWLHDNRLGIHVPYHWWGYNLVVENTLFERNIGGANLSSSSNAVVKSSVFRDNGTGIGISGGDFPIAGGHEITNNMFTNNTSAGVYVFQGSVGGSDISIARNKFIKNGGSGIFVKSSARVSIEGNVATGNGYASPTSGGTTLNDGIHVEAHGTCYETAYHACTPSLSNNIAMNNADYGIEAVGNVSDGGGNKALNNGNRAQCLNILCRPSSS